MLALAGASAVPVAGYDRGRTRVSVGGVLNGAARFTVACKCCAMRLVVDRIGDAEATALADHLRTRHPWLCLPDTAALGATFSSTTARGGPLL